jgi:hypothetical protein
VFSHKSVPCFGNVLSEPLPSNELFRLSGVMLQYCDMQTHCQITVI